MLQKLFYDGHKPCPVLFWQKWKRPQIKLRLSSVYLECSAVVDRYTLGLIGNVQERGIITLAYPTWILICFGVFEKRLSDQKHVFPHGFRFLPPSSVNDLREKGVVVRGCFPCHLLFDSGYRLIDYTACGVRFSLGDAAEQRFVVRRTRTNWSNNQKGRLQTKWDWKIVIWIINTGIVWVFEHPPTSQLSLHQQDRCLLSLHCQPDRVRIQ